MILDKELASPNGIIKYKTTNIKKININLSRAEKLNFLCKIDLLLPNRNNIKLE